MMTPRITLFHISAPVKEHEWFGRGQLLNGSLYDAREGINMRKRHGCEAQIEEERISFTNKDQQNQIATIKTSQAEIEVKTSQEKFELPDCRRWRVGRRIRSYHGIAA